MKDINIQYHELEAKILKLEEYNSKLEDIIKNINCKIKSLDENIWNSPEKKKLDEQFIPYIEKLEMNIGIYLKVNIDVLKKAVIAYQKSESNIKNQLKNSIDII